MQHAFFNGIPKRNKFIGIALVGPNYEMFAERTEQVDCIGMRMMEQLVDGVASTTVKKLEFVANVQEHLETIEFLSDTALIVMDDVMFAANGYKAIPNRYTYVICDDPCHMFNIVGKERSKTYKLVGSDKLENLLRSHEQFHANPLIFVGSSKLFIRIEPIVDVLRLTKITSELDNTKTYVDFFPVELYKPKFSKYRVINSEISDANAKLKINSKANKIRQVEVLSDHIQMVKTVQVKSRNLELPIYKFIEFLR